MHPSALLAHGAAIEQYNKVLNSSKQYSDRSFHQHGIANLTADEFLVREVSDPSNRGMLRQGPAATAIVPEACWTGTSVDFANKPV